MFIALVALLASISAGTVLAADSVKLYINGKEVRPLAPLQIVENRVMVPVRQIAEALDADVEWDEANQTVKISNKTEDEIDTRLKMLEFAVVSGSPEEVANTWAKGRMSRNGALQYAVMSDDLKSKYKSDLQSWNWMPGASSPWMDNYEIIKGEEQQDGTWKFTIKYHYTDSTKSSSYSTSDITVGPKKMNNAPLPIHSEIDQKWCVIAND